MKQQLDVLTVRDVLRPGPRQWVNAEVVLRVLARPSDDEMGDICDATPAGTVSSWEDDLVRFTWPLDNPVAADGALERIAARAREAFHAVGFDAVPIEARLEVPPYTW